ncbi:hypothetical protein ACIOJE_07820 [Kitasatospora sp. NPDC087861]|uniref:hypothetical protein n=1 Tax=Kitasatospora sp. NPDC087861 TaxID=3364070 RepID=UPI00382FE1CA
MTVAINGCQNASDRWVSVINNENRTESRTCSPSSYSEVYFWISQHANNRPSIQTKKGLMWIQDDNWEILGEWEFGGPKVLLAKIDKQPRDYVLNISADGEISLIEK